MLRPKVGDQVVVPVRGFVSARVLAVDPDGAADIEVRTRIDPLHSQLADCIGVPYDPTGAPCTWRWPDAR
jgi:hypothetical protein